MQHAHFRSLSIIAVGHLEGGGRFGRPLRQIASNVKAQDIKIFTIQFANADSDLQILMREIATSPHADHYFNVPDVDTLESNFEEIANRFSMLYLAK